MKTKDEIKTQVLSYLEKASKHLFVIEKDDVKTYYKIVVSGDNYYTIKDDKMSGPTNINKMIDYYGGNTKNVIKTSLFLTQKYGGKTIKSVKYTRAFREKYADIIKELELKLGLVKA